jgi:hypothetical protein
MDLVGGETTPLQRSDIAQKQNAPAILPDIKPSRSKTCLKIILEDCMYEYQNLSGGQPCLTIPIIPASCTPSSTTAVG